MKITVFSCQFNQINTRWILKNVGEKRSTEQMKQRSLRSLLWILTETVKEKSSLWQIIPTHQSPLKQKPITDNVMAPLSANTGYRFAHDPALTWWNGGGLINAQSTGVTASSWSERYQSAEMPSTLHLSSLRGDGDLTGKTEERAGSWTINRSTLRTPPSVIAYICLCVHPPPPTPTSGWSCESWENCLNGSLPLANRHSGQHGLMQAWKHLKAA